MKKWAEVKEAMENAQAAFDKLSHAELAETLVKNQELSRAFGRDGMMKHGRHRIEIGGVR